MFSNSGCGRTVISMMDDIEFHFVELGKMKSSIADLNDPLEIWVAKHLLANANRFSGNMTEEEMQQFKKNPALKEAEEALEEISQNSETRLQYDRRKSALFFYEKTLDKKFAEGKLELARAMLVEGDY